MCYFLCGEKDWAGLDTMMSDSRSSKLQSLQKIEEMQEFLEFIDKEGRIELFHLTLPFLSRSKSYTEKQMNACWC